MQLKLNRIALAFSALLLITLVATLWFLKGGLHKYTPKSINKVNQQGTKSKSSLTVSLKYPADFQPTYKRPLEYPGELYEQKVQVGNKTIISGYNYYFAAPLINNDYEVLSTFNRSLSVDPNTAEYKGGMRTTTYFVHSVLWDYKEVQFGRAQKLVTPNIRENAWIYDVTATGAKDGAPDQQGKAFYAWTNKTAYSYLLTVAKENWQPNISTWNDMINSFKLNENY
jgi:hypothetical protein